MRKGGLGRRVRAGKGVTGRQDGAGRLSAPGRAIGARRARARSLRLTGPAWVRSCSTAAGGATARGSPASGAAALASAVCRGEGGRAVACCLVVAGARRGTFTPFLLKVKVRTDCPLSPYSEPTYSQSVHPAAAHSSTWPSSRLQDSNQVSPNRRCRSCRCSARGERCLAIHAVPRQAGSSTLGR